MRVIGCVEEAKAMQIPENKANKNAAIKHVFVLMLENRSFDHMLGFSGISGRSAGDETPTSINGLNGNESNAYQGTSYPVSKPADWSMPSISSAARAPCTYLEGTTRSSIIPDMSGITSTPSVGVRGKPRITTEK